MPSRPRTLGQLRTSGYRSRSVKQELRENLVAALRAGRELFPGIVGYEDSVVPDIVNALLAGHDFILLGLRGQAKSRILRALSSLLDPDLPYLLDTPLRDDPFGPVSPEGKRIVAERGDDAPIGWIDRSARYQEKLATPDVSMADLLGDIDPIRAAARGHSLLDEEAIAYGIIPRSNRGIFAINELPDLAPRIQVALLNVMEERDVQIRGFPFRLPLDLLLTFSANPEDYTKRGNMITPLRDRIAAQIHTHYPRNLADGLSITAQEAWVERGSDLVQIPELAREIVEEVASAARASEWVDQSSGVSARMTIALIESLVSNAERRALQGGYASTCVRISDFFRCLPAISGKIELVFEGEREGPEHVATHLVGKAIQVVFDRRFPDFFTGNTDEDDSPYQEIAEYFKSGGFASSDDNSPDDRLGRALLDLPGMVRLLSEYLPDLPTSEHIFGCELVLEGLHQHSALAKEKAVDGVKFTDMVSRMWEDFGSDSGRRR